MYKRALPLFVRWSFFIYFKRCILPAGGKYYDFKLSDGADSMSCLTENGREAGPSEGKQMLTTFIGVIVLLYHFFVFFLSWKSIRNRVLKFKSPL